MQACARMLAAAGVHASAPVKKSAGCGCRVLARAPAVMRCAILTLKPTQARHLLPLRDSISLQAIELGRQARGRAGGQAQVRKTPPAAAAAAAAAVERINSKAGRWQEDGSNG